MDILLYIWGIAAVFLILYYLFFHLRLVLFRTKPKRDLGQPVSVVICARNEMHNLKKNLPKILSQKNSHFEVIVVNDRSSDGTAEILDRYRKQYPNLKVVENTGDPAYAGKKKALVLGLENVGCPYVVLTDADCEPRSDQWLASMSSNFVDKKIVLGFSPYLVTNSLAGRLTQWETLLTAQNYLSFALAGLPYMGVGRNLGYEKELFEQSDRFVSHLHLPSGDDDLFIGQAADNRNTTIEISEGSFTWSPGPKDLKTWWRQKRRHLTTSYSYKRHISILLGLFGLSQLIFYTALWPLLFFYGNSVYFEGLLWGKFLFQSLTLVPSAVRLKQQKVLWMFPLWEVLVTIFLAVVHLQNKLAGRPNTWN